MEIGCISGDNQIIADVTPSAHTRIEERGKSMMKVNRAIRVKRCSMTLSIAFTAAILSVCISSAFAMISALGWGFL